MRKNHPGVLPTSEVSFNHGDSNNSYRGINAERDERVLQDLRRNWKRHPELRMQHGNDFKRYIASTRHNVTFC